MCGYKNLIYVCGLCWVVELTPIVCKWDLDLREECPSRGVFLRDLSLYLSKFLRKPLQTPND